MYCIKIQKNAISRATSGARPPFKVRGPLHVQATIFKQKKKSRLVLHLLNDPNPIGYPPFRLHLFQRKQEEAVPVHDITLSPRGTFRKIHTVPGGKTLPTRNEKGYASVKTPPFSLT